MSAMSKIATPASEPISVRSAIQATMPVTRSALLVLNLTALTAHHQLPALDASKGTN
jgi:hypothetical protein